MSDFLPGDRNQRAGLRKLFVGQEPILAPGAYDALTARVIEQAGFPAVYMTGFGTSAAAEIRANGAPSRLPMTFQEFNDLIGLPEIQQIERRFSTKAGRSSQQPVE